LTEEHADRRLTPWKNAVLVSHQREKGVGLFRENPGTHLRLRHSLSPELDGDEEEDQELPDSSHGIWNPSPGITPQHDNKPAKPTTNP
jgi:hypothetical protein